MRSSVKMSDEKKAIVTRQSKQKSNAIGKNGINIRLASMLTGIEIELNEIGGSQLSTSGDEKATKTPQEALKDLKALFGD